MDVSQNFKNLFCSPGLVFNPFSSVSLFICYNIMSNVIFYGFPFSRANALWKKCRDKEFS